MNESSPSAGLDRPLGLQNFEATRICRQSAHESGEVVSATRRSPLRPQEIPLVLISVRG